jgi:hypothetical protein
VIPECGFPAIESNGKFGSIETKDELRRLLDAVKEQVEDNRIVFRGELFTAVGRKTDVVRGRL